MKMNLLFLAIYINVNLSELNYLIRSSNFFYWLSSFVTKSSIAGKHNDVSEGKINERYFY